MNHFRFSTTPTIVSRPSALSDIASILLKLNSKRPFIITDKGIVECKLLNKLQSNLDLSAQPAICLGQGSTEEYSFEFAHFEDVLADPSDSLIKHAITCAQNHGADAIIGFGGGSSMDTAKLVALLASKHNSQTLEEVYGVDQANGSRLPLVLIPTTAGTGSEATAVAIVTTGDTTKAGVVSDLLYPDIAILDATLTIGLPAAVTAATGIDAMVHAIEAYTSNIKKNIYSDMLCKQALVLLSSNIHRATLEPNDIEARQAMLIGACMAGQAFANAPVAAVHALAYPLGGHFHIPHGLSNSLVLPHVMRFNATVCFDLYSQLADFIQLDFERSTDAHQTCHNLIDALAQLAIDLNLPVRLQALGVGRADLPMLAADAILQTRLLINNPIEVTVKDALAIYTLAF